MITNKERVIQLLEWHSKIENNNTECLIRQENYNELAEDLVKLLPIQHVSQRSELFVCETCGGLLATKEGEECFSCANPIDTTE